jgi:hypothetical protein
MGLITKEEFYKQEGMKEEKIKNEGVWKFSPYIIWQPKLFWSPLVS